MKNEKDSQQQKQAAIDEALRILVEASIDTQEIIQGDDDSEFNLTPAGKQAPFSPEEWAG